MKIKNNKNNKYGCCCLLKAIHNFFFYFFLSFLFSFCMTTLIWWGATTHVFWWTTLQKQTQFIISIQLLLTVCTYICTCVYVAVGKGGGKAVKQAIWLFDYLIANSHNLSPIFERQQLPLFSGSAPVWCLGKQVYHFGFGERKQQRSCLIVVVRIAGYL